MTKLNLSFTSLAFAVLPLVIAGCDQKTPQTDTMTPDSMTATNAPQTMQTNSMNSMAPNTMSGSNQMQMGNMGSTNNMAPNSMSSTNQM